jgi:hypothetical protein
VAPAPAQQVGGGFRTEPPIAPGNMATLRDDFRSEPSFQMFTKSRPAYDAMLEAAKTDSAASDLILIYSFAQIGDPGSSVKEGETQMIERNGALMERAKGQLMQMTQGTGKLTANQRIDLVNAAHAKMMQLEGAYNARGAFYGDIAKRQGGNPLDVVQQFGKVLPPNPKEINMYAAPTASGPTGPLPQQREITFDPITGAVR